MYASERKKRKRFKKAKIIKQDFSNPKQENRIIYK